MKYLLSIIIPFKDSKKFINKNLSCCIELSKNSNIEIIYINNLSSQKLDFLKKKISKLKNINLYNTPKKNGIGPGIGRNLGIKKSKAKFILFLDIDDLINLKNFKNLLIFLKKFKYNILTLKKVVIKNKSKIFRIPPNIDYSKKKLVPFFIKKNNMECIGIIYKKDFLKKNKINFNQGIYEDIFFVFKTYFINKLKIIKFNREIYLKYFTKNSITNSKININKIKYKFLAFRNIIIFLKKNLTKKDYLKIKKYIQYRLRAEFANQLMNIKDLRANSNKKNIYVEYLKKIYIKLIDRKFLVKTKKDQIVKSILNV